MDYLFTTLLSQEIWGLCTDFSRYQMVSTCFIFEESLMKELFTKSRVKFRKTNKGWCSTQASNKKELLLHKG